MKPIVIVASLAALLGGCSSVIEGTHQEIAIASDPPGANCVLKREGFEIGRVNPTPGAVKIDKTKYDITVVCDKDGYQEATIVNRSGAAAATFGNIILGGGIGWAVDSASGADNKYDSPVTVKLDPVAAAAMPPTAKRN
jgi:hypothetical protein